MVEKKFGTKGEVEFVLMMAMELLIAILQGFI